METGEELLLRLHSGVTGKRLRSCYYKCPQARACCVVPLKTEEGWVSICQVVFKNTTKECVLILNYKLAWRLFSPTPCVSVYQMPAPPKLSTQLHSRRPFSLFSVLPVSLFKCLLACHHNSQVDLIAGEMFFCAASHRLHNLPANAVYP